MLNDTTSPIARTGLQSLVALLVGQFLVLFGLELSGEQQGALVAILVFVVSVTQNVIERRTGHKYLAPAQSLDGC